MKISLEAEVKLVKHQNNFVGVLGTDEVLRIFTKEPLKLINCYFMNVGNIAEWVICEKLNYVMIISGEKRHKIIIEELIPTGKILKREFDSFLTNITWIVNDNHNEQFFYFISPNNYFKMNITTSEFLNLEPRNFPFEIKQFANLKDINLYVFLTTDGKIFGTESIEEIINSSPVPTRKIVKKFFKGPRELLFLHNKDNTLAISNLTSEPSELKLKFENIDNSLIGPDNETTVLFNKERVVLIDEFGQELVSYKVKVPMVSGIYHFDKKENSFLFRAIYTFGIIEDFYGSIDKKKVLEEKMIYKRKFETLAQKLTRIVKSIDNIKENLNKKRIKANEIQNHINQCKVYQQQLHTAISTSFGNIETLPIEYQVQLELMKEKKSGILSIINKLDEQLKEKFEITKHLELESINIDDRVIDFIAKMHPRESVSISEMAKKLEIEYENCIEIINNLKKQNKLPGTLKEITKTTTIDKNLLFVKEDPELKRFSDNYSF
ncbi:MAG: hypothetical protein ACFFD1_04830 [Candidatus Thorarchaeota archaeon]